MSQKKSFALFFWVLLLGVLGSSIAVGMKYSVGRVSPLSISTVRFLFSLLVLSFIKLARKPFAGLAWPQCGTLLVISLFGVGNFCLFALGVKYTTASLSQLLYLLTPVLVCGITFVTNEERLSAKGLVGTMLALLGASLAVWSRPSSAEVAANEWHGIVLIILAVVCYAVFTWASRRFLNNVPTLQQSIVLNWSAVICFFLLLFFDSGSFWPDMSQATDLDLLNIMYVGIFGSALFYFLIQWVIKTYSAFAATLVVFVQPFTVFILSYLILGEHIPPIAIGGAVFAMIGVYLTTDSINKARAAKILRQTQQVQAASG